MRVSTTEAVQDPDGLSAGALTMAGTMTFGSRTTKKVREKFWRPKPSSKAEKVLEVNPNIEYSRVLSVELANDVWRDSIIFLSDKALFVKWGGSWPAFSKFRDWCNKNWGEGMDLKTLGNGYYQVVCPTTQDRDWIIENGPFFLEGKGLTISTRKPNFNPYEALVDTVLIWIKLSGLPREYKDLETLKQIGCKLGEFVMAEEYVGSSDFTMVSRLCINWQPVHNLPDTLEIKTGSGFLEAKKYFWRKRWNLVPNVLPKFILRVFVKKMKKANL
ncbi:hypothetical protein SUGI_0317450 [Cryptomeria japonica]|nr:hypothetical protein SUGI_0317450 [Cryptomeria japonica]